MLNKPRYFQPDAGPFIEFAEAGTTGEEISMNSEAFDAIDTTFMQRCVSLAHSAVAQGEYPFAVVISQRGEFVCEAHNRVRSRDIRCSSPAGILLAASVRVAVPRETFAYLTEGRQRSLRAIAEEFAKLGYLNERGVPFSPSSVQSMLS